LVELKKILKTLLKGDMRMKQETWIKVCIAIPIAIIIVAVILGQNLLVG